MKVRRCKVLYLEPREDAQFDIGLLLAGGTGLRHERRWVALAPHLGVEVEVGDGEVELLRRVSAEDWIESKDLIGQGNALRSLLSKGLLISQGKRGAAWRARDDALRAVNWHPLAAAAHAFSRWQGVDAVQPMRSAGMETAVGLRAALGTPPPEAVNRLDATESLQLGRSPRTAFDHLLARRATCRNFDAQRSLPLALFSQLLERVFAAQSQVRAAEETVFLKKTSPSGGGLHPIEAYLAVQNVEGVAPGLYHYQPIAHALEPMPAPAQPLGQFILEALAQQHWFADAHALVLLAPRFDRTFWKYRGHAKGYRVVALEAGHLSQTLYLSATDAGLGAFVTGAINEVMLEQAFGLDPLSNGVLAICGFGWRSERMVNIELDPAGEVWMAEASATAATPA